jgi:hypothetical protein
VSGSDAAGAAPDPNHGDPLVERYLEHVRVEKRLAARSDRIRGRNLS